MAGAGGFPSLGIVLRHVHEFASFLECDLFFSPLVVFFFFEVHCIHFPHYVDTETPDLKGTLKVPLGSSKALVFSAQANASKNTCSLERSGFLCGQNLSEQHP